MKRLTKDDLFEIEKIIDIYSSWVNDKLARLCNIAINQEAMMKTGSKSPLNSSILSLTKTYKRVREISAKLEKIRKNGNKKK